MDKSVKLFLVEPNQGDAFLIKHLEGIHYGDIGALYYSSNDQLLFTGSSSDDNNIKIFLVSVKTNEVREVGKNNVKKRHKEGITTIHYYNKHRLLFTGSKDKSIKIFKVDIHTYDLQEINHFRDIHNEVI